MLLIALKHNVGFVPGSRPLRVLRMLLIALKPVRCTGRVQLLRVLRMLLIALKLKAILNAFSLGRVLRILLIALKHLLIVIRNWGKQRVLRMLLIALKPFRQTHKPDRVARIAHAINSVETVHDVLHSCFTSRVLRMLLIALKQPRVFDVLRFERCAYCACY